MKLNQLSKWMFLIGILTTVTSYGGNDADNGGSGSGSCNNCVSFYLSTGPMNNYVDSPPGRIGFLSDTPSPTLSTPQGLKIVEGRYGLIAVENGWIRVRNSSANKMEFKLTDGESVAVPAGQFSTSKLRIYMVDANGAEVTNAPAYYDLYTFNGLERMRFSADTNSVNYLKMTEYRTEAGRPVAASEFGVQYIYDSNEVIRQIKAPTRLLDVVTFDPYKYKVDVYDIADVNTTTNSSGLYEPVANAEPYETWTVENPDGASAYNRLNIYKEVGGHTNLNAFTYYDSLHMWSSTRDGGQTMEETTYEWDASNVNCTRTKAERSAGENPVYKYIKHIKRESYGVVMRQQEYLVSTTNSVSDYYDYYSNSSEPWRYQKLKSEQDKDGSWSCYDYDTEGRKSLEISSWLDVPLTNNAALAKATYYDYTPHISSDVLLAFDNRPRTVTEKTTGIITKKTFYAYTTNSAGAMVNIEEKCLSQNASYGDAANLRTTTTFYGPDDGALLEGRIKTIEHPDGQLDVYTYERGTLTMDYTTPSNSTFTANANGLAWRVSVLHASTSNPTGVPYKSLKEVSVKDAYGKTALEETYVYQGSTTFSRLEWAVREFDQLGHALHTWHSDHTEETEEWGSFCCGRDSSSDRYGIEYSYTYDDSRRIKTITKMTTNNTPGVVTTYDYDAKGRKLDITRSAGSLSLSSTNRYDMLGRKTYAINESKLITSNDYDDVNNITTETLPGGTTKIRVRYADGRIKSVIGTAVVHETYEYGVNSDGTIWTKTYLGADGLSSERWTKTTTDMLGRMFSEERPSTAGDTLKTLYVYNSLGKLWKRKQLSGTTLVSCRINKYDSFGDIAIQGLDANADGDLELASMDRIVGSGQWFEQSSNDWYEIQSTTNYPDNNAATNPLVTYRKTRLTGSANTTPPSGVSGVLANETISVDVYTNQTVSQTWIDRDARKLTRITQIPSSSVIRKSVSVNGQLVAATTSASGDEMLYRYDGLGHRTETEDPRTGTAYTRYNAKGQVYETEDAAGDITGRGYDGNTGRLLSITDPNTNTVYYTYNDRGQKTGEYGATYPVKYIYDDYGQRTDMYTYRGTTNLVDTPEEFNALDTNDMDRTQWAYQESTGLMTNKMDDAGNSVEYTYSALDHKLETRTWARKDGANNPITTTYTYTDYTRQLETVDYSDSTPDITRSYDRMGLLQTVEDGQGYRVFNYTDAGALDTETLMAFSNPSAVTNYVLNYRQDDYGRSVQYKLQLAGSYSPEITVDYGYDGTTGRLKTVTNGLAVANYNYVSGSDRVAGHNIKFAGYTPFGSETHYEDDRNLIQQVDNGFLNGQNLNVARSSAYSNDNAGRRTARYDSFYSTTTTNTFGYNAHNELETAEFGTNSYTYGYDNIGNRLVSSSNTVSTTYAPNSLDQYTNIAGGMASSPSCDADGNLLCDGIWTNSWNAENRLVSMRTWHSGGNPQNGDTKLDFAYDYDGRRYRKIVSEYNGSWVPQYTNTFTWSSNHIIYQQSTASGSPELSFVWGQNGKLLAMEVIYGQYTRQHYFYGYDANRNVTDLVDHDESYVAHYEYDAYGNPIGNPQSSIGNLNPFRFGNEYVDTESGWVAYKYRYYSPELGRWLSRDPVEERDTVNMYSFVKNNSLNSSDSLGLISFTSDGPEDCFSCEKRVLVIQEIITVYEVMANVGLDFGTGKPKLGQSSRSYVESIIFTWACVSKDAKRVGQKKWDKNGPQHFALARTWFYKHTYLKTIWSDSSEPDEP